MDSTEPPPPTAPPTSPNSRPAVDPQVAVERAKRIRMIVILASVAVVGLILWLNSGYGLGHDVYTAPDNSFQFSHPGNYTVVWDPGTGTAPAVVSAVAGGPAGIRTFTVVRKVGYVAGLTPEQCAKARQLFLDEFFVNMKVQPPSQTDVTRAYGASRRAEVLLTSGGPQQQVAVEVCTHNGDLYFFGIEGPQSDILKDAEGELFFNSIILK